MSYQEGPSLLEYARFHGLAVDHAAVDLFKPLSQSCFHFLTTVEDSPNLPSLTLQKPVDVTEKIQASKETAQLLSSVLREPSKPSLDALLPNVHRVRDLKQELPLLKTDHNYHVSSFKKRATVPSLFKYQIPHVEIDEENDGGLTWPVAYHRCNEQLVRKLDSEKLDSTREVLLFIQNSLRDYSTKSSRNAILDDALKYQKAKALVPLTPPLLPLDPEALPFVPPSRSLKLELLSDKTSPGDAQRRELEKDILENDTIPFPEPPIKGGLSQESMLLDFAEHGPGAKEVEEAKLDAAAQWTPLRRAFGVEDLKVEVPLTPPRVLSEPKYDAKDTALDGKLQEMVGCEPRVSRPGPDDFSDLLDDDFLGEMARLASEKIEEQLSGEKVESAEFARVDIPDLKPAVPTVSHRKELNLRYLNDTYLKKFFTVESRSERSLQWAPFPPHLAKVEAAEAFTSEHNVYLASLLQELDPMSVTKSKDLLWTPKGLHTLDQSDSEDEELHCAPFHPHPHTEIEILSRSEDGDRARWVSQDDTANSLSVSKKPKRGQSEQEALIPRKREGSSTEEEETKRSKRVMTNLPKDPFAATASLSKFIETRRRSTNHPAKSRYFATVGKDRVFNVEAPDSAQSDPIVQVPASPDRDRITVVLPLPCPSFSRNDSQTIFVNSSLLKSHRGLVRRLEASNGLTIIFRDFEIRRDMDNSEDADILLSPTRAVILTTIQATTQSALPGHKQPHSLIRDRIARLASQYDDLHVLVASGTSDAAAESLSQSDCAALNSVSGYCANFEGNVSVTLVPSTATNIFAGEKETGVEPPPPRASGEEYGHEWILGLVARHAFVPQRDGSGALLQDETLWELFLRRVGMNAFAAQVVLGMLKKPSSAGGCERAVWGLRAFVKMGKEERVKQFAGIVGLRAIRDLSDRIDASWDI